MKIEVGKQYRLRGGGISGVLELVDDEGTEYLRDPDSGFWYDPEDEDRGSYVFASWEDDNDLVAEAVTSD